MGGQAMKHVGVERKPAKEYFEIAAEVVKLAPSFAKRHAIIPAYTEKESFGDLDCLVVVSPDVVNLKETLVELFKPTDITKNGDVWSFDYKKLQIDIICTSDKLFNSSLHYYSYNDVSNLVGRSAHKAGLKYGHQGLILPVRADNTHLIGEVVLSTEPKEIFEYLGYDYDRFTQGFKNLDEIFHYVVSSPFFDRDAFREENLNHTNRTRNAKRPTFTNFVKWLELPENAKLPSFTYTEDKSAYIQKAVEHFAHNQSKEQLTTVLEAQKQREGVRAKFNGQVVTDLTGLQGKELGEFMAKFSKQWETKDAQAKWILESSEAEIKEAIQSFGTDIEL